MLTVKTAFVDPPIPIRQFDYVAWFDGIGEEGPTEHASTEAEAVRKLWASQGMTPEQKCMLCGQDAKVPAGCAIGGCPIGNDF